MVALLHSGDFAHSALFSDYLRHPSPAGEVTNDRLGCVLGDTQPPDDQAPFLANAALSTSASIRLGAIQALGGMNGPVAKKALEGAVFDPDSKIRAVAVEVICESSLACDASRAQQLVTAENIPRIVAIAEKWRQTSALAVSP